MIAMTLRSSVLILAGILLALSVSRVLEPSEVTLRHSGLMQHGSGSGEARSPERQLQHDKLRFHRARHQGAATSKAGHAAAGQGAWECCDGSAFLSECPLELTDVASRSGDSDRFFFRVSYLEARDGLQLAGIVLDKMHDPPRHVQT